MLCFALRGHAQTPSTTPLYLFTTGSGQISPFITGELLTVGQNYEMQASPDPGYQFSDWRPVNVLFFTEFTVDAEGNPLPPITSTVLSPGAIYSDQSVLDFTMQPSTVVIDVPGVRTVTQSQGWQANFVPTPEPSTLALMFSGGTAIVLLLRARSRRALGWS